LHNVVVLESVNGGFQLPRLEFDIGIDPGDVAGVGAAEDHLLDADVDEVLFVPKLAGKRGRPELDSSRVVFGSNGVGPSSGCHLHGPQLRPFSLYVLFERLVERVARAVSDRIRDDAHDVEFREVHFLLGLPKPVEGIPGEADENEGDERDTDEKEVV
jgi:hypothetical protein